MKHLSLFISLFLLGVLTSCSQLECGSNPDALLDNFENFVDQVGTLDLDFESKQWAIHDKRFEHFLEDCYEHHEEQMTKRQRRRFWLKTMKYLKIRYGTSVIRQLFSSEDANGIESFFDSGDLEDLKERFKELTQ